MATRFALTGTCCTFVVLFYLTNIYYVRFHFFVHRSSTIILDNYHVGMIDGNDCEFSNKGTFS